MNLTYLEVKNVALLKKVFEFRYKILLEIYPKYLKSLDLQNKQEVDKYDKYSIHFVALNTENEVCATVRLIYNSPIGYPTENCLILNENSFDKDKLGEMSRIFVDSKYRGLKNTKQIIQEVKKFMYVKLTILEIHYTYGALEENFLRLLKIYKMKYEIIGEKQLHKYFGLRYPCILYTKQLIFDNPDITKTQENNYL